MEYCTIFFKFTQSNYEVLPQSEEKRHRQWHHQCTGSWPASMDVESCGIDSSQPRLGIGYDGYVRLLIIWQDIASTCSNNGALQFVSPGLTWNNLIVQENLRRLTLSQKHIQHSYSIIRLNSVWFVTFSKQQKLAQNQWYIHLQALWPKWVEEDVHLHPFNVEFMISECEPRYSSKPWHVAHCHWGYQAPKPASYNASKFAALFRSVQHMWSKLV